MCDHIPEPQISSKNKSTKNKNHDLESKSIGKCGCVLITSISVLLASILIGFVIYNINNYNRLEPQKYNDQIKHVPSHPWQYVSNFFQNDSLNLLKELALNEEPLSTIVEENSVESAGEAVPAGHLDCRHPFMTLNINRTMCHFSNRLDVGMHFVKTGGFNGYIEYYESMVARMIPFRKRLIQQQQTSGNKSYKDILISKLNELNEADYVNKLKTICAENFDDLKNIDQIRTELFQFDILLMLPGQEMPMHLNVPYFWGANRHTLPQWLLVAMKQSHLFDHLFVPQVQSLTNLYLDEDLIENIEYEYVDTNGDGGDFYLYPYLPQLKLEKNPNGEEVRFVSKENVNKYIILKSKTNSVIMLDGSQVTHGVDRYKPKNQAPPLYASKNHHYKIKYNSQEAKWYLFDSKEKNLITYAKNEVRLMVVWNSHCFRSEREKEKFLNQNKNEQLKLSDISERFKDELRSKERLPSDDIEPLELWTIVIKDYLKYPINIRNQYSTLFGFNYCLLHNVLPGWITDNLLKSLFKNC